MNFVKFILGVLGFIFLILIATWLFGLVSSVLWYAVVFGLLGVVVWRGYKLFLKAEKKYVGEGASTTFIDDRDYDLTWDEYKKKYLPK